MPHGPRHLPVAQIYPIQAVAKQTHSKMRRSFRGVRMARSAIEQLAPAAALFCRRFAFAVSHFVRLLAFPF